MICIIYRSIPCWRKVGSVGHDLNLEKESATVKGMTRGVREKACKERGTDRDNRAYKLGNNDSA